VVKFKILGGVVNVDKEITKLDEFTLEVIDIIKKHADYLIISGYVAIFFGRSRATEDVDIFIKDLSFEKFNEMYNEFIKNGYELTIDNAKGLYYDYLKERLPVNVWRKNFPLLRVEIKLAVKPTQLAAFNDRIIAKFKDKELVMSDIESQIAYKRYIARSDKDLADAKHLELVFEGLSEYKIQRYRKIFEAEFNGY